MTAGPPPTRVTPGRLEPSPRPPTSAAAPTYKADAKDPNSDLLSSNSAHTPYPSERLIRSIAAKLPPPHAPAGVTAGIVVQQMAGWTPLTVKDVLRHMVKRKHAITFTGRDAKGHRKVFYKRAAVTAIKG